VGLLFLIAIISGIKINWYFLQIIYYYGCMLYLLLGLGWIFSSLRPFMSDIGEIIGVVVQLGFWYTPIIWDVSLVPAKYQFIFKINPMYYIVQGYRDSIIYNVGVWQRPKATMIFFMLSTIIMLIGVMSFKKLRPHFNDVL